MSSKKNNIFLLMLSAMLLAMALYLPFLTGQIPEIGNMLCPMHLPVLLCGFLCGPTYGLVVGFVSPLLRFLLFGVPPLIPKGISMCFELAVYGFVSGLLYRKLPRKKLSIYIALFGAMTSGRIVWGIARTLFFRLGSSEFGWEAFMAGAFLTAIPGIIVQIILIPVIVMALEEEMVSS